MEIKFRIAMLLMIIMAVNGVRAQKYKPINPVKGFIITHAGDTIQGTIDYLSEIKCASGCMFMRDGENDYRHYTTDDLQAYRLLNNGVFYVRRSFPINGLNRTFFAEFLLKGSISLYHLNDDGMHYYFLEDEDGNLAEIRQSEYENQNAEADSDLKRSKGLRVYQASQMLNKSMQAVKDLQRKEITSHNLTAIVRQYNEEYCVSGGDCVQFEYDEKASRAVKPRLRVEAGGAYWKMSNSFVDVSFLLPGIGIGFELDFPRLGRRLAPQVMLQCSRLSHTFKDYYYQDIYEEVDGVRTKVGTKTYDAKQEGYLIVVQLGCLHRFDIGDLKSKLLLQWSLEPGYIVNFRNKYDTGSKKLGPSPIIGLHAGAGIEIPAGSHPLQFILGYDMLKQKGSYYDKINGLSLKVALVI